MGTRGRVQISEKFVDVTCRWPLVIKTSTKICSHPRVDVFREECAEGRVLEEVSRAEGAVDVVDAREEEERRGRAQRHDPGQAGWQFNRFSNLVFD